MKKRIITLVLILLFTSCGTPNSTETVVTTTTTTAAVQTTLPEITTVLTTTDNTTETDETSSNSLENENYRVIENYVMPNGVYQDKDCINRNHGFVFIGSSSGICLSRKDSQSLFSVYYKENTFDNDYTVKDIKFDDLYKYNPNIFDATATPEVFDEFELEDYNINNELKEDIFAYSRFNENEQMNYISKFNIYGHGENILRPLYCWGLEKTGNESKPVYYRFTGGEKIAMTENEFKAEIMPDFHFELPDSLINAEWHSDYIIKPIIYDYYFYDENITDFVPQELIDGLETEVKERYRSDEEFGWFGIMEYDIDDDEDMDLFVVGTVKNEEYFDPKEHTFTPYGHFSGVGLNVDGEYKYIKRSTTKYNATGYNTDDGFILSTKTNGFHDIYIAAGDGLHLTFDGESAYQPLDLNYASNFIMEFEPINEHTARLVMKPMNGPDSDDVYYVALKFASDDNMNTIAFMYSNKASGEIAYYRHGISIDLNDSVRRGMTEYEFFIPIEMYNELNAQDYLYHYYNLIEVKYIFETPANPESKKLSNLDDIIEDVEARNENFEVIDSEIINLNNDSFDDVIVLSLRFLEANFSYYTYDGNAYTLLNDVKLLRAFNFHNQVFEFGSIPGEIENLIIKDFEYDGETIKTVIFSRHFYFEQLNYIAEIYIDSNNEFSIRAIMAFGLEREDAATGQIFRPVYYRNIDGEQTAITASEFYPLASKYLSDEEIAFPTDPAFAFEPDSVNIRGYKIPLDCEEFAIMNFDMPSHPIILNTIEIDGNITDEDIAAISQLKNLRTLGLINVGVNDISFLKSNKNLERIFLDYNEITDIAILSGFSHLNLLTLSENPTKDINPLSKLASLEYLDLSFTDIDSISGLPENLISLSVQKTNIKSFDRISKLEKLQILNICDNNIDDISFLEGLSKLEDFYASNNDITDISPLKNKDLKIIHMTSNEIQDFSVLAGLNSPTELRMDFTDEDVAYFESLYPDCIVSGF